MKHLLLVLISLTLFCLPAALPGQCGLQSGPMNGYSTMTEVAIWIQTRCTQKVQIRYWKESSPSDLRMTDPVLTAKAHGNTAKLIADHLDPGSTYLYEVLLDNEPLAFTYQPKFTTQTLWQWRTDAPDFTFVAGSCTYINEPPFDRPGRPYGGDYQIFTSIIKDNPDFMVWLGDNMYLREADWNSRSGIYHRYTHTRTLAEMQPLLAQAHHYATWDDHDYGPNDSDWSYWGKDITREAFVDFWANPNIGVGGSEGITGTFEWQDCAFFILDDRWYREPRGPSASYFGEIQLKWLVDALRFSTAPFKFICTGGQVVSDAAVFENYAVFAQERKALLDSLDKYNIKGVVFLTGDRHHSEISRMQTAGGNVFYDITSSALTSSCSAHPNEPNHFRVPDSMIGERNYAMISVSGPAGARVCKVVYKDSDGKVLFEHTLQN